MCTRERGGPDGKIAQVRYRAPRNAIPPIPPGPEGSNGNGLVCVQRVSRYLTFVVSGPTLRQNRERGPRARSPSQVPHGELRLAWLRLMQHRQGWAMWNFERISRRL